MKKILLFMALLVSSQLITAQSYFQTTFPDVWQRGTDYTIAVLTALPEEHYDYKPLDDVFTFREQAVHLIGNLGYLSGKIEDKQNNFLEGKNVENMGKEEIIILLNTAFKYVSDLQARTTSETLNEEITFSGVKMTKENMFYLIRDHMTHHRAQCILYLRLNNIDAPKFVGW
jgi:uncharacterized damage-inducible protein DinB